MARYTENLNLYEKEPSTDGDDKVSIRSMLNDNWDKIDTKVQKKLSAGEHILISGETISAIDVVPTSRTINGQPLSDDVIIDDLPSQSGNAGKFLTTNGSNASWADPLPNQSGNASKFLMTNGSTASWGNTYCPTIFSCEWSDHLKEDMSWLRADTFSWQDGTVYANAYDELASEYNNESSVEETEGNIAYKKTPKGYKIALASQEQAILDKYVADGIAWYYILDTTNTQFKLPRNNSVEIHGLLIDSGEQEGVSYRVYQDGYCEQWGSYSKAAGGTSNYNSITLTFSKEFKDTNYIFLKSTCCTSTSSTAAYASCNYAVKSTGSITTGSENYSTGFNWKVCGYLAEGQYPSFVEDNYKSYHKYLYFYVGRYTQTAIEQTAGLNAELFNGKVDVSSLNKCEGIVETYSSGTSGYRVWSDGYCEQWGQTPYVGQNNITVDLLKEFRDTNYSVSTVVLNDSVYAYADKFASIRSMTVGQIVINTRYISNNTALPIRWRACGYLANEEN